MDDEGWSPLPPPADDEAVMEEVATTPSVTPSAELDDERAQLRLNLLASTAERSHRTAHNPCRHTGKGQRCRFGIQTLRP